jgi:hypothetical protein
MGCCCWQCMIIYVIRFTVPITENCQPVTKAMNITVKDCVSDGPLLVSYCSGVCPSSFDVTMEAPFFTDGCKCCKPSKVVLKTVQLTCGTSVTHIIKSQSKNFSLAKCNHIHKISFVYISWPIDFCHCLEKNLDLYFSSIHSDASSIY